jgi:hypothetical protein
MIEIKIALAESECMKERLAMTVSPAAAVGLNKKENAGFFSNLWGKGEK